MIVILFNLFCEVLEDDLNSIRLFNAITVHNVSTPSHVWMESDLKVCVAVREQTHSSEQ